MRLLADLTSSKIWQTTPFQSLKIEKADSKFKSTMALFCAEKLKIKCLFFILLAFPNEDYLYIIGQNHPKLRIFVIKLSDKI